MEPVAGCCVDFYQLPITQFLLGDSFHPGGLKLTRQLAQQLLISRESRVLDVASGRGTTSLFLAEQYGCELVALDLAGKNLAVTHKQARKNNLSSQLLTIQAGADQLPFDDNTFDAIICECALCTFSQPQKVLAQMKRVLKPGGRLGISDIVLNRPLPEELNSILSRVFCISGARTVTEYSCLLSSAGFSRRQSHRVDWAITEMVSQIEKQSILLESLPADEKLVIPNWLKNNPTLFETIQEFVKNDGLGYLLISARK
jgi:arsenite methyltransferase